MTNATAFFRIVQHPIKFRFFLLMNLPAAFFSRVRIRAVSEASCTVTVPYRWFTKNPFRSTYFACLAMAAEMSTGVLAMAHIYQRKPAVSMLVLKVEGNFMKKAADISTFVCNDGNLIQQMIEESIATGEGRTVTARSIGHNKAGETVAEFLITWSFKAKLNG